jgi:hypothetical protein
MYLIIGFNFNTCQAFYPDPGLFATVEEAQKFCDENSVAPIVYSYKFVQKGVLEI